MGRIGTCVYLGNDLGKFWLRKNGGKTQFSRFAYERRDPVLSRRDAGLNQDRGALLGVAAPIGLWHGARPFSGGGILCF